jgi:hypothetical protein
VIGWRFATTSAAGTTKPRYASAYSSICNDPKPAGGDVRVAVVVDYGSASDWPPGEKPPVVGKVYTQCVTVPAGSRASTALSAAHLDLRIGSNGLICGINGFPSTECAPVVSDPVPTPTRTATHAPSPTPTRTTARPTVSGAASTTPAASPSTAASSTPSSSAATGPASSADGTASAGALATTGATPSPTDSVLPATTEAPVASAPTEGASSTPWGAVGGVAVVVLVGGAAWWTMRRGGAR